MDDLEQEWRRKGGTLSDKTARKEFGLTYDQIVDAINSGRLHYRLTSMYGNPWLRLLRREVEELVADEYGERHLRKRKARAELPRVESELQRLRSEIAVLEERRASLMADLGEASLGGTRRPRSRPDGS